MVSARIRGELPMGAAENTWTAFCQTLVEVSPRLRFALSP